MRPTRDDVSVRGVVWTAAGLMVVTVAAYAVVGLLFSHFSAREAASPRLYPLANTKPQLPPQPRLQADPSEALKALRQRDREMLSTYGWINEQNGVVRIPIDRAMALIVERGLPVRSVAAPAVQPQPSNTPRAAGAPR